VGGWLNSEKPMLGDEEGICNFLGAGITEKKKNRGISLSPDFARSLSGENQGKEIKTTGGKTGQVALGRLGGD